MRPAFATTDSANIAAVRPSSERLRRRRDFAAVYARKRSWAGPLLALYLLRHGEKNLDRETRRYGFVVSKKAAKRAHDRNRVKRRLREICRLNGGRWRRGFDVVFVVRSAAVGAAYADLESSVLSLMRRAGVEAPPEKLPGTTKPQP